MTAILQNIGFDDANRYLVGEDGFVTITLTNVDVSGSPDIAWRVAGAEPAVGQNSTILIEKTLSAGEITIVDVATKVIRIKIDAADTEGLPPGDYYHEVRIVQGSGITTKPTTGLLRLHGSLF